MWVSGAAGRLYVDDGGPVGGTPVILLHGLAGSHEVWAAQVAHLRRRRRTVAFDMRGMGRSEAARDQDYSIASMAHDLRAVLDALTLDRVVLVGHSFGGAVAGAAAGTCRERVAGVLFVDPSGDARHQTAEALEELRAGLLPENYARFTKGWFDSILIDAAPATRQAVLASLRATPREVFVAAITDLLSYDPAPALVRYRGPRLSVVVERFIGQGALHLVVPGLPHRVLTGVSHWPMLDRPGELNALLDEFLATVPK